MYRIQDDRIVDENAIVVANTTAIVSQKPETSPKSDLLEHLKDALDLTVTSVLEITLIATLIFYKKIVNKVKECIKESKKPVIHPQLAENTIKIYGALGSILSLLDAERALIFELHNGQTLASGVSFMKFSVTYELSLEGLKLVAPEYQNIPITMLGIIGISLEKDEILFQTRQAKLDFFMPDGTDAILYYPIKSNTKALIGFIAFYFYGNVPVIDTSYLRNNEKARELLHVIERSLMLSEKA